MLYRSDIDGLRAVAVILVVLFHAGLGFPGGFVGVDVFFVISGFLITGIIARDLDAGTFSLVRFYDRRIRRILPPLVVMVVVTVLLGWLLFLPEDLKDLAKSAMSQVCLAANIYFWRTMGYFNGPADQKPLLHMWSLAIEEQFYLLFPVVLMLIWKFCRRAAIPLLALFTFLSFCLCVYGTGRSPSASFYLLPTRAWELSAGALLSLITARLLMSQRTATCCGVSGLLAILTAGCVFSKSTPFPGWAALLPCGGAALVIAAGQTHRSWPTRLLMIQPLVGIGLISYSLYLWHWPIFVLSRYWAVEGLGIAIRVILVLASIAVGWLSWRFIESPFRVPRWNSSIKPQRVLMATVAFNAVSLVLFVSLLIPGIQPWLPQQAVAFASAVKDSAFLINLDPANAIKGEFPRFGSKDDIEVDLLVWGDSHAMAAMPVIDSLCQQEHVHGAFAAYSSTPPLVNFVWETPHGLGQRTPQFSDATLNFVQIHRVRNVVLIGLWSQYIYVSENNLSSGNFSECLTATIKRLREAGATVSIMLEVPQHKSLDIPKLLARESFLRRDVDLIGVPVAQHQLRVTTMNHQIREAVAGLAVVLDPLESFANSRGFCPAQKEGKSLYRDNHHLTVHGSMQLADLFRPIIERIANSKNPYTGSHSFSNPTTQEVEQ